MPTDLSTQLRSLIGVAPAVSAQEATERAQSYPTALTETSHQHRPSYVVPTTIAASAIVLAGAGIGWAINTRSPSAIKHGPLAVPTRFPKTILTAAEVRRITAHSSAASSSSGTATVTQTSAQDGVAQNGFDTAVTFDGSNIDEKITSVPEPPGSVKSFTTDDRFVDGQFYIHTPGPGTGDVSEWLHDTASTNDAASMQFPDPRTLYGAISPKAQFEVEGTASTDGTTTTHLKALNPSVIDTSALDNLAADSSLTSFELWVDQNDVVQKIALATSATNQVCNLQSITKAEKKPLLSQYGKTLADGRRILVFTPNVIAALKAEGGGHCGPQTTSTNVTVTFANLGLPQSVTAPQGAVNYQGKG